MRAALLLLLLVLTFPAWAVEPGEALSDPVLEARARAISKELRCLVCQNESIDESHADLAKDLRLLVRERLKAGDSDDAVMDYIARRYGDFVRLRPPLNGATALLWFGPFAVLAGGALIVWTRLRRAQASGEPQALSDEERARLAQALKEPPAP